MIVEPICEEVMVVWRCVCQKRRFLASLHLLSLFPLRSTPPPTPPSSEGLRTWQRAESCSSSGWFTVPSPVFGHGDEDVSSIDTRIPRTDPNPMNQNVDLLNVPTRRIFGLERLMCSGGSPTAELFIFQTIYRDKDAFKARKPEANLREANTGVVCIQGYRLR